MLIFKFVIVFVFEWKHISHHSVAKALARRAKKSARTHTKGRRNNWSRLRISSRPPNFLRISNATLAVHLNEIGYWNFKLYISGVCIWMYASGTRFRITFQRMQQFSNTIWIGKTRSSKLLIKAQAFATGLCNDTWGLHSIGATIDQRQKTFLILFGSKIITNV